MNSKTKYWIEDNKEKLYIGGAVLALSVVALGSYLHFTSDKNYNEGQELEITMADYILTQRGDGSLETISIKDNQPVGKYELSSNVLLFSNENLDGMYLYEDNSVSKVAVSGEGDISFIDPITVPELEDVTSVSTNGLMFGFLSEEELVVTDKSGKAVLAFEEPSIIDYQLGDVGVYLSQDDEIRYIDYAEGKTQYIDIGDKTTRFSKHGNSIVARNDFGSGENVESVLTMEDGSLIIEDLKRVPHQDKVDVKVPQSENRLVYVQETKEKDGGIKRQELASIDINSTINAEEDIDFSSFSLLLDTDEEFASFKSLALKGFLYDYTESGIRVIEMRNGREATRVATHSEEPQLFVPIFND